MPVELFLVATSPTTSDITNSNSRTFTPPGTHVKMHLKQRPTDRQFPHFDPDLHRNGDATQDFSQPKTRKVNILSINVDTISSTI